MKMHVTGLFLLIAFSAPGIMANISAQENRDEITKALQALEKRIEDARRHEVELVQQKDVLFRQLLKLQGPESVKRDEALVRLAMDRAWSAKYRPTIEMRAKLHHEVHTLPFLIYPPQTRTDWFVKIDGQRVSLKLDNVDIPTELKNEQEVEVFVKGKLEVQSTEIMMPIGPLQRLLVPQTLVIHVESLKKAVGK